MRTLHPIWLNVAEDIADRVDAEGYGFLLTHEDLYKAFGIDEPGDDVPFGIAKAACFDFMSNIVDLSSYLLKTHNILLHNERGAGYRALTPDDQVTKGFKKHFDKALCHLHKSLAVVVNVDSERLSKEAAEVRDRNISRSAFVLTAARKRKVPQIEFQHAQEA